MISLRANNIQPLAGNQVMVLGDITANAFYGDGSHLTGITGGTGNPSGNDSEVQFNDNGSFGASSAMTFDSTLSVLGIQNVLVGQSLTLSGATSVGEPLVKISQPDDLPWAFAFYNDTYSTSQFAFAGWTWNDGRFSMGTETDKSIEMYVNADYFNPKLTISTSGINANGSVTATTFYGDGSNLTNISADVYFEATYSEMQVLKGNSGFTPGVSYAITDFRTCYEQPDYEIHKGPSLSGTYKTAAVHPIVVKAISESELAVDAYQPDYPNDKIKYYFDYNTTLNSENPAYGRIIERIDEFNNRTDYDHREVLFKRYRNFYHDALPLNGLIDIGSDGIVTGKNVEENPPQFDVDFAPGDFLAVPEFNEYVFEVLSVNGDDEMQVTGLTMITATDLKYYKGYRSPKDDNLRGYNSYYPNNIDGKDDYQEFTTFQYKTPANFMQRSLWTLNNDYSQITSLVPNIYMFWDDQEFDDVSVGINDGGDDMYDGGNFLNTDLTNPYSTIFQGEIDNDETLAKSSIPYTHTQAEDEDDDNEYVNPPMDGKIMDGTPYFGSGSTYFTNMYPGLFIMVADNVSVSEFSITGDVGSDDDTINAGIVEEVASGWTLFYKTNHGDNSDPSINHLILLPGQASGVTHVYEDTDGNDYDDHAVQGISDRDRIIYAVVATQPGTGPLGESDAIAVAEQIIISVSGRGETVANNFIGDYYSLIDWEEYQFDLPNNVFGEDVLNSRIGAGFENNTFVNDVEETRIADYCTGNIYEGSSDFDDNVIGNFFRNNKITHGFESNKILDYFENNYITSEFTSNIIGQNFSENVVAGNFYQNQIGYEFIHNKIFAEFNWNLILNEFDSNSTYYTFRKNNIGSLFNTNTIGSKSLLGSHYFENNDIQNNFKGNLILSDFWSNRLKTDFKANETLYEFGYCDIGFGCFANTFSGLTVHNKIGDYCTFNAIFGSFCYNVIGTSFYANEIEDGFGFGAGSFQGNIIGNNFSDNTIGEYFYNNKVMDNFASNTVGFYFQQNNVTNEVSGYNFSGATHVYGQYNCDIFRNSASSLRLSYYTGDDVLTVTDITN